MKIKVFLTLLIFIFCFPLYSAIEHNPDTYPETIHMGDSSLYSHLYAFTEGSSGKRFFTLNLWGCNGAECIASISLDETDHPSSKMNLYIVYFLYENTIQLKSSLYSSRLYQFFDIFETTSKKQYNNKVLKIYRHSDILDILYKRMDESKTPKDLHHVSILLPELF